MSANLKPIDATHGDSGETYTLNANCFNCGWNGLLKRLMGTHAPSLWECPRCGCRTVKCSGRWGS